VAGDPLQTLPIDLSTSTVDSLVFRCLQWRSFFRPSRGVLFVLLGNHRHGQDEAYAETMERVRLNQQTGADLAAINATWLAHTDEERLVMPQLRALRGSVETYNLDRLAELAGDEHVFVAVDKYDCLAEDKDEAKVKIGRIALPVVTLKIGAPVVATRRLSSTVPTGTTGAVVSVPSRHEVECMFKGERVVVTPKTWDAFSVAGKSLGTRTQMPLLLAWALTIHRAQGSELERVCIDFTRDDWACEGLVYTALSRVRSYSSLCVRGLTLRHIQSSAACLSFWLSLVRGAEAA